MHILHVVGARPNFMKAAPILHALQHEGAKQTLVHTGQHYDVNMSDVFFRELDIPEPDINLAVGSDTHSKQTARIMMGFEGVLLDRKPNLVLVYGDVNSTLAASLVCAKLRVAVGHVEAGLRSFDRSMPEEINRMVTDRLSDVLFTPSADGDINLLREGVSAKAIHLVGNVMIDTLVRLLPKAASLNINHFDSPYALLTLHRPGNVDDPDTLRGIMSVLVSISKDLPVIFPVHPRTRQKLVDLQLTSAGLTLLDPLSYLEFLALQRRATVVLTDSGGIQEETTFLGIPCLTIRPNTERPITVEVGTNILVGHDTAKLRTELEKILSGGGKQGSVPPLWDGHTGARIAKIIKSLPCQ